jgi:hypothetical protein
MIKKGLTQSRTRFRPELAVAVFALSAGCTGNVGSPEGMPMTPGGGGNGSGSGGGSSVPGAGNTGTPGAGSTGVPGGGTGPLPEGCTGSEVVAPKRLIRLSFNQIANTLRVLLSEAAANQISEAFQIGDPTTRTFPPLANPREGSVIIESNWQSVDGIAQAAGKYVLDNFATATNCGAMPTDACGQQYLATLAAKAYRRPLTDAEKTSLTTVFTEVKAAGGTVNEAVQFGVYAVFSAPQFLYRTEFGANPMQEGPLAPYEMASELSYFLTDGPPDQALLDAAAQGALSTAEQIAAQTTRLLGTDAAKRNLQTAMFAYFSLSALESVVVDPMKAPQFNLGLRNAMYRESELFLNNTLWSGQINDLLTSRRTTINADLAALYGVPFPPAGVTPGADGFAPVELPPTRSGMMTQAGFLTSRARPDNQSVVGRGLLINASILCAENPPFPEALAEQIDAISASMEDKTEREKAEYRGTTAPCSGCHVSFDAFGLALETFDVIGKHRTVDEHNRPIDPSVTLPITAGGGMVKDAVEMSAALAATGSFETCVARSLISYALAEGAQVSMNSCSTQVVANAFKATQDRSFASMIREVAISKVFSVRSAGGAQ